MLAAESSHSVIAAPSGDRKQYHRWFLPCLNLDQCYRDSTNSNFRFKIVTLRIQKILAKVLGRLISTVRSKRTKLRKWRLLLSFSKTKMVASLYTISSIVSRTKSLLTSMVSCFMQWFKGSATSKTCVMTQGSILKNSSALPSKQWKCVQRRHI